MIVRANLGFPKIGPNRDLRKAEDAHFAPMEMAKWFDTNYHYIVPEFEPDQTFRLASLNPSSPIRHEF